MNIYVNYKTLGYCIGEADSICGVSSCLLAMLEKIKTSFTKKRGSASPVAASLSSVQVLVLWIINLRQVGSLKTCVRL